MTSNPDRRPRLCCRHSSRSAEPGPFSFISGFQSRITSIVSIICLYTSIIPFSITNRVSNTPPSFFALKKASLSESYWHCCRATHRRTFKLNHFRDLSLSRLLAAYCLQQALDILFCVDLLRNTNHLALVAVTLTVTRCAILLTWHHHRQRISLPYIPITWL